MQTDTGYSLREIRSRYQGHLVPQLLEIQNHRTGVEKSIEWARNLQCLYLVSSGRKRRRVQDGEYIADPTKLLRRKRLSRTHFDSSYVAVSYPWEPSQWENPAVGGYSIQSAKGTVPSKVRDVILERVTAYTRHHGASGFWIDKECLNQDDPEEKEVAMQSMDLVYCMSKHPVGLLTRPIESQAHLNLLLKVLFGEFMGPSDHPNFPHLKLNTSPETSLEVLELLGRITSDPWWERAWIFQEEYLSSVYMNLLIPHLPALRKGRAWRVIGDLPGELEVNSAKFRRESTLFCLAYLRKRGHEWQPGIAACEQILQKAASYKILYEYPRCTRKGRKQQAMSPTIFADIGRRNITNASDILPIAANCCDYSVRLNTLSLRNTRCSLSLCILALYLLNGEITRNDRGDEDLPSSDIFDYLKNQSLDNFDPPVEDKELTFIKNCRFVDVRLSPEGIITTGLLWKLHKEIDTSEFASNPPSDGKRSPNGLRPHERSRLLQLAYELNLDRHQDLVNDLYAYLDEDFHSEEQEERSSKYYKDLMAKELVRAIIDGKTIQLGCLLGQNPYSGIFIREPSGEECLKENYVFTAWKARIRSDDQFRQRRSEKYVSLEVNIVESTPPGLLHLETKRWINGLCFFDGYTPEDVIFPWPHSLRSRY
jgi:Heterokaryon incompatibility protein (HET)